MVRVREIFAYAMLAIISLITYKLIPVGAIISLMVVFASARPVATSIVISTVVLAITNPISIAPLILYATLFIVSTIFIKPLKTIESRHEKKKIGTYLVIIMTIMIMPNQGLIGALILSLIMLAMYKFVVTAYSVIIDEEKRIVHTTEDRIAFSAVLITSLIIVLNIIQIDMKNIEYIYYTVAIISAAIIGIRRGILNGIIMFAIAVLIVNLIPQNADFNVIQRKIYLLLSFGLVLIYSFLGQIQKNLALIILWIINFVIFMFMTQNIGTYSVVFITSVFVSFALKGDMYDYLMLIRKRVALTNNMFKIPEKSSYVEEKEDNDLLQNEHIEKNEAKQKESSKEDSSKKQINKKRINMSIKAIKEKVEETIKEKTSENVEIKIEELLKSEEYIRKYEEYIVTNKEAKKLTIHEQLVYLENIIKNIYLEYIKNGHNEMNIYKLYDILNLNNLIVDIENEDMQKELGRLDRITKKYLEDVIQKQAK